MTDLLATLDELIALLCDHEERHWSAWLSGDAERLRQGDAAALEHLLSAWGGMGSLSDLYLCPENGHRIEVRYVEAVNQELRRLTARTWDLARELQRAKDD